MQNNAATASMADSRKVRRRVVLGLSLPGWENVMVLSLVFAGLFGTAAAVATYWVVQLTRDENRVQAEELEEYKAGATERVADLTATAEQLRKDTAVANARAAEAELKTAELEAKMAPRSLSEDQKATLVRALKPFAGQKVQVQSSNGNSEARRFSDVFRQVFVDSGWLLAGEGVNVIFTPEPVGLELEISTSDMNANTVPKGTDALIQALESIGLRPNPVHSNNTPAGLIELKVGSKPL